MQGLISSVVVIGVPNCIGEPTIGYFDAMCGEVVVAVWVAGFGVASGAVHVFLELGADVTS